MHICYIADVNNVHLHRWAAFFIARGHQVSVITDTEGTVPGAPVYGIGDCLPGVSLPVFSAVYQILAKAWAIRRALRQIKPDLVHGHYATNYGFLAALSGFTPLVQTVHGSDVLVDTVQSWERRLFVRYALRRATLITSVAEHMTRRLIGMGLPAERILTFQYGVDTTRFTPPADPAVRKPFRVVSTRMLEWRYNLEQLLRAVPLLRTSVPEVEVVLAGDGPDQAALQCLTETLGIHDVVTMVGRVAHDSVPALLQSATVYVSTSLTDGASLSLLEGMACGAFPVVTDIPGNREWVTDGMNGFLVPVSRPDILGERIAQALTDPALRADVIKRNTALIQERGDYQRTMAGMEDVYHRLCG